MGFGWWTSGSGGVGGRGRASTHGAFLWVGDKKSVFEFFGAGRGGPWSEGEGVGVGVDRSGVRVPLLGGRMRRGCKGLGGGLQAQEAGLRAWEE